MRKEQKGYRIVGDSDQYRPHYAGYLLGGLISGHDRRDMLAYMGKDNL